MKVRLSNVTGDQEEYADLIGYSGELRQTSNGLTFFPNNRGDWLTMSVKRKTQNASKVTVSTKLGNTFTFTILTPN